ncbi:MAG: FAD-dependent oxidoreductase [Clostridiales bacterium]|nr:FAD-dependent oxidoreductase [Clostridiales bacterium]
MNHELLFTPVSIGNCTIKNRFAMAPLGPLGLCDAEGGWNKRGIDYYVARAKGGVGLIHTGLAFVDNTIEKHAAGNCASPNHNPPHFVRTSSELNERIHAYGCKIFLQLTGGFGRTTVPKAGSFFNPVAPSPIMHRWKDVKCRALSKDEIRQLISKFADGAYIAKESGFDGIQIHAVHEGYLLDQFAMSLFNRRTDEYGGNLDNQLRIIREIIEGIHRQCGDDYPVTMRFSLKSFIKALRVGALPAEEFTEMGRDIEEGKEVAIKLEEYGYAALDVDVGSYDSWWWSHPPMYQEKGLYIPYAKITKETVNIPVICAGRMDDPEMAEKALQDGACDIVSLGRPLLADADYVNKLYSGKLAAIRPCLSCQEGCMGRIGKYSSLNCSVNPACCREADMALMPALQKKRVLVIGGGPAGCEAARVLALRGHIPILYEAQDKLGGCLLSGGVPKFKEDSLALAKWYEYQLKDLGVPVRLNTKATAHSAESEKAEAVIVASGGNPRWLPIEHDDMVVTAEDALLGKKELGQAIVVIGGSTMACEIALWCALDGKKVRMIVRGEDILTHNKPLCHANSGMLKELIYHHGIEVIPHAHLKKAIQGIATLECADENREINADTVILAIGYDSNRELFDEYQKQRYETYLIGDARQVNNIMYAIWDAYEIARHIN